MGNKKFFKLINLRISSSLIFWRTENEQRGLSLKNPGIKNE